MTRRANPTLPGEILDAAERIVASEGPGALSMRRLAGETGVTSPTLYYYFTSKDRLLALLRLRTAKRLNGKLQRVDLTDTRSALLEMAEAYISFAEENAWLFRLLCAPLPDPSALSPDERRALHFPYFAAERVLEAGRTRNARGAKSRGPAEAQARDGALTRWIALHGFVSLLASGALENVSGLRREELKAKFLEIYARGAVSGEEATDQGIVIGRNANGGERREGS